MEFPIDIWLRGDNHATTDTIAPVAREPRAWTDGDIAAVLEGMLRALERARDPGAPPDRPVALRGFSWIVSPFEGGGHTVAVEIQIGAAAAGPFDVDPEELEATITRVMAEDRLPARQSPLVH
jgi:hypothetical protein